MLADLLFSSPILSSVLTVFVNLRKLSLTTKLIFTWRSQSFEMSAKSYQAQLRQAEEKLLSYQQAANDWKGVAEDLVAAIAALGKSTEVVLTILNEPSEVLSVEVGTFKEGSCWNDPEDYGLIFDSLVHNVEVLAKYSCDLQQESSALESSVNGVVNNIVTLSPLVLPDAATSRQTMVERAKKLSGGALAFKTSIKANHRETTAISPASPQLRRQKQLMAPGSKPLPDKDLF